MRFLLIFTSLVVYIFTTVVREHRVGERGDGRGRIHAEPDPRTHRNGESALRIEIQDT